MAELLVVVVIIGVLSSIVLPKFNHTLEVSKTTEAENLLRAIRMEQEYRCASEKAYATNKDDLGVLSNNKTKNFTISFEPAGAVAHRTGQSYSLKIPSYADGRICCDGKDCLTLNKNYPTCRKLKELADFVTPPNDCGVVDPDLPTDCTDNETSGSEACGSQCGDGSWTGTRTIFRCVDGVWKEDLGPCVETKVCPDPLSYCSTSQAPEAPAPTTCNGCGTREGTYVCNEVEKKWEIEWGACSVNPGECECHGEAPTETQTCNSCGTMTKTWFCNTYTGEWSDAGVMWSACSKEPHTCECTGDGAVTTEGCNICGTREKTQVCDLDTGEWTWTGALLGECSKKKTECSPEEEPEDEGDYTCVTSYSWYAKDLGSASDIGSGATWFYQEYLTDMVCGGETEHNSGTVNFQFKKNIDCTPGKSYLYWQTYGCGGNQAMSGQGGPGQVGWYCLTCGRVKSLSQCASAPSNMNGQSCSLSGSVYAGPALAGP